MHRISYPNFHRLLLGAFAATVLTAAVMSASARAQDADESVEPAGVVVVFAPGVQPSRQAAMRAAADTTVVSALGRQRFQLLSPRPGQSVADAVAELRARPGVVAADPNVLLEPSSIPDDPLFGRLWGMQNTGQDVDGFEGAVPGADIDAPLAWDRTVGDPSVVVADIDTGYLFGHPDLGPVAWRNPGEIPGDGIDNDHNGYVDDWRGWDALDGDNDPTDTGDFKVDSSEPFEHFVAESHGSHTAGTIGARGNDGTGVTGVAQNVRIMPIRAGTDVAFRLSSIIEAMNYAGANGARVANMSLNAPGTVAVILAAQAANQQTLFVASAGNFGWDVGPLSPSPCDNPTVAAEGYVPPPGVIDNVVCVAATDQADQLASFSDYGGSSVDLGAPGTETLSTMFEGQTVRRDFATGGFADWTTPAPPADDDTMGFVLSPSGTAIGTGAPTDLGAQRPGTTNATQTPPMSVPAGAECTLHFETGSVQEGDDRFSWTLALDGTEQFTKVEPESPELGTAEQTSRSATFDVPSTGTSHTVTVRFVFHRGLEGAEEARAVLLNGVRLDCLIPTYGYLQGTSMAAPLVSGTAGLLFSLKPSATVTQVRNALLDSVDPLPSLAGKTVSGGRLNAWKALSSLVPMDTRITSGPTSAAVDGGDATFTFDTNNTGNAGFECRLDLGQFEPCTSPKSYESLTVGEHEFYVRSAVTGGVDATPASADWTVAATAEAGSMESGSTIAAPPGVQSTIPADSPTQGACKVPDLLGRKLRAVKRALRNHDCRLGTVTRKAGATRKAGRVERQNPRAGRTLPLGSKVKVTLKP
jgi:subtilisin family serine protease